MYVAISVFTVSHEKMQVPAIFTLNYKRNVPKDNTYHKFPTVKKDI